MKHSRIRSGLQATLTCILVLFLQCSVLAQKVGSKFDALPTDGIVLATMDINAIRNVPELEFLPWELLSAASIDQIGIDALKIQSLELSVGLPSPKGPEGAMIVHTSSPVEIADLALPGLGPVTNSPLKAEMRFRALEYTPFIFMQAKPSFLVLSSEGMFRRVMIGRFPKNRAVELLQESTAPVRIVLTTDLLRPIAMEFLEENSLQLPETMVSDLLNIIEKVDHVRLTSTAGLVASYSLDLYADSDESIQSVERSLRALLDTGMERLEQGLMLRLETERVLTPNVKAAIDTYFLRLKSSLQKEPWQIRNGQLHIELEGVSSVATFGGLAGLLLPAVQSARESTRSLASSRNVRELQLAMLNYESTFRKLPARTINAKDGSPLLSWRVAILPFLSENQLYSEFHLDEPWDSPHNLRLLDRMPKPYENPRASEMPPGYTNYVTPYMAKTLWSKTTGTALREITDGTANTISLMETLPEKCVPWTAPQDLDITGLSTTDFVMPSGSNFAFCDCSVISIASAIDIETLHAWITHQGGEFVDRNP